METTEEDIRELLGGIPREDILDELADRISARLSIHFSTPRKLTITIDEAAALLGLCYNTVSECCKTGQLPAVKLQGKWLISVPGLMERLKNPPDPLKVY